MSARIPALVETAIVERLQRGGTFTAVARHFGVTYKTVTKVAYRNGFQPRTAGRPRKPAPQSHPSQKPKRPPTWVQPALAAPTRDLAKGRTRWRCPDCGALAAGTTCLHGHVAPWAPSLDPLEVSHG